MVCLPQPQAFKTVSQMNLSCLSWLFSSVPHRWWEDSITLPKLRTSCFMLYVCATKIRKTDTKTSIPSSTCWSYLDTRWPMASVDRPRARWGLGLSHDFGQATRKNTQNTNEYTIARHPRGSWGLLKCRSSCFVELFNVTHGIWGAQGRQPGWRQRRGILKIRTPILARASWLGRGLSLGFVLLIHRAETPFLDAEGWCVPPALSPHPCKSYCCDTAYRESLPHCDYRKGDCEKTSQRSLAFQQLPCLTDQAQTLLRVSCTWIGLSLEEITSGNLKESKKPWKLFF